MGWGFRKSIKIMPGVRLNVGTKSAFVKNASEKRGRSATNVYAHSFRWFGGNRKAV
ncbi:DUF4236 domain-containing protein [Brevibacillus sp. HD1.4A]|nr:DUF4236 domain-containing protein [Brevibacillus sp. HD1.4A]